MIITEEVEIKLNPKVFKHYKDKGYSPILKDTILKVKVQDLSKGSRAKINIKCDNCDKISLMAWGDYIKNVHNNNNDIYYCYECAMKLFARNNIKKSRLKNTTSFQKWCVDNSRQDILDRWDYELNKCSPNEICYRSNKKYYFKCPNKIHKSELRNINCIIKKDKNKNFNIECVQCNSILVTNPYFIKYFVNEDEAKKYSISSNKKVLMKCPDCGYEKIMIIENLTKQGFSCPKCSDGISYPEKFMLNFLERLNVKFDRQKKFNWSKNKKYDFYLPNYNCIIETHGMQHYKKLFTYNWGLLKDIKENDKIKRQLAKQNNIKYYIIINCSYSNLGFIKNSIINSKLIKLLNFKEEDIDWLKCHECAISNRVRLACELWNTKFRNTTKIAKELKVDRATIVHYLKKGTELNWCDYDPKEASFDSRKLTAENNCKETICLNTNEIFPSVLSASQHYNIQPTGISRCCNNKIKHCGIHPITGEPLKWMFYKDYLCIQESS
jgi:ribosomal protein S27E